MNNGSDGRDGETSDGTADLQPAGVDRDPGDRLAGGEDEATAGGGVAVQPVEPGPLITVGVGASAGGLEAFTELLQQLPADAGLALVLVQHLAPQHESALPQLLGRATAMPVEQAHDDQPLQPNHVYVIPPGVEMSISEGRLQLTPRAGHDTAFLPVNRFFRSLAADAQDLAVGVVLSGTASDGAEGLREIIAAGGIALVQDPDEARYDGMPRAAIAHGGADLALPIADIARELVRIGRHPLRHRRARRPAEELEISDDQIAEIFEHLRRAKGVDFTHYKPGTIKRRLQRRMVLNRLSYVEGYLKLLREQPAEIDALYQDVLIHVTRFFREPESFETLKGTVLPRLLEHPGGNLRCWIPNCATGEEVYSLAIVLSEVLEGRRNGRNIQIFGTDISEESVEEARRGLYPESIAQDISPERLRRWFTRVDQHYRVAQTIRDKCVFARQDITRDPPFSNIDLILCRNVLIYLGSELQKRVLGIFHYALRPDGYLVLGSAETIGTQSELFTPFDKRQRIFSRRPVPSPRGGMPLEFGPRYGGTRQAAAPARPHNPFAPAEQLLLEAYSPAAVVLNDEQRIVHTRGRTGYYLELAAGDPDLHLLKMARPGLMHGLRAALLEVRRNGQPVRREQQRLDLDGQQRVVNLAVWPVDIDGARHYLVAFEDVTERPADASPALTAEERPVDDVEVARRVRQLQDELEANRDYLQSTIQDLEAANEELQSANEEILSSNEELQSTNEELDTAKEELQSTNEELHTVNEELHARNRQLVLANSDLGNLLASVDVAIIMVALDLRIRRFTPVAEKMFNLIEGDIDRPIGHIKPNIDCPDLEAIITRVIDRVEPAEHEVHDADGRWYSLRIRPYKSLDNRIDGAVLIPFDIDANKRHAIELQEAYRYADALMQVIDQPLLVLDRELRVRRVNRSFTEIFKVTSQETEGQYVYDLGNGQWDIPDLRRLLEEILPQRRELDGYRVSHAFPQIGRRTMALSARAIENADSGIDMILLVVKDVGSDDGGGAD